MGLLDDEPRCGGCDRFFTSGCADDCPVALRYQVDNLKLQKDDAYAERDKLVTALANLFPASLERHPEEDRNWEDDWRWIVFIELPTGQATWHIHDSELPMFDHLQRNAGLKWDGHTTEQKYDRLSRLQPQYKRVGQLREGQKVMWNGVPHLLETIEPYGPNDYVLSLSLHKGHVCVVPLSVYNDALAKFQASRASIAVGDLLWLDDAQQWEVIAIKQPYGDDGRMLEPMAKIKKLTSDGPPTRKEVIKDVPVFELARYPQP